MHYSAKRGILRLHVVRLSVCDVLGLGLGLGGQVLGLGLGLGLEGCGLDSKSGLSRHPFCVIGNVGEAEF